METQKDVEDFWRKKEEALQETVLFRSIGQWAQSAPSGAGDIFGLLYATESRLLFEYSDKPRRSILDTLLRGRQDDRMDETLAISRMEIRWVRQAASSRVRRWVRRNLSLEEIEEDASRPYPDFLQALLGSHLCIGTTHGFYAFQTPADRKWAELLQP